MTVDARRTTAYPRLVGVDLARTLALLGMFAAHVIQRDSPTGPGGVDGIFQVVAGRSAALFALLAGVSVALASRDAAASPQGHRWRLALRSAAIAVLGLILGGFPSGVAVILTYYGVLFCCAIPVLTWRARSLAWLAVGWGVLSPVASMLLRRWPGMPEPTMQVPNLASLDAPVQLATELLVTGYYPVLTWATYLFAGLAVGRALVPATTAPATSPVRLAPRLALGGAVLFALSLTVSAITVRSASVREQLLASSDRASSWEALATIARGGFHGTHPPGSAWWLTVWSPHSGSIVDLVHTVGGALLILGVALLVARRGRAWRMLSGAGAMTLTLYAVHVVVLASPLSTDGPFGRGEPYALALHSAAALLVGAVFALLGARGPLEALVRRLTGQVPVRPPDG